MASYNIISFGFVCLCLLHGNSVHGGLNAKNPGYFYGGLFGEKNNRSSSSDVDQVGDQNRVQHVAAIRTEVTTELFFGGKANLNVWSLPGVGANQATAAAVWVVNGDRDQEPNFNSILAGWNVHPELYGDNNAHFFVYWTADGHRSTGCFNLQCKGFVLHPSAKFIPGSKIDRLSAFNGDQYTVNIKITRDPETGHWLLHSGPNSDEPVGYFPRSLFTGLAQGATRIQWGGVVSFYKNQKSPPMGNGHYPHEGGFRKSAFLRDVKLATKDGKLFAPSIEKFEDKTDCYQIGDPDQNQDIYFGGPGGCTD